MSEQILEIQQGIWIDQFSLQQAGLGKQVEIRVQEGEIRISSALKEKEPSNTSENGWNQEAIDVFRFLGQDATIGQLPNTSINHDQYLYGKTE